MSGLSLFAVPAPMHYAADARAITRAGFMRNSYTDAPARSLRLARLVAGSVGVLLIAFALLGGSHDVLLALPVVFLMTALLAGRYPGLRTLERLAGWSRARPVRASRRSAPARGFGALVPRALRLLVGSRELRGPPSASLAGL
jgi:hypothetical protein